MKAKGEMSVCPYMQPIGDGRSALGCATSVVGGRVSTRSAFRLHPSAFKVTA